MEKPTSNFLYPQKYPQFMLRLVRQVGMATAFSTSAVLQLIAINFVAIVSAERARPSEMSPETAEHLIKGNVI